MKARGVSARDIKVGDEILIDVDGRGIWFRVAHNTRHRKTAYREIELVRGGKFIVKGTERLEAHSV